MAASSSDPHDARRQAEDVLAAAHDAGDHEAAVVALRAAGLAARELEDLAAADASLRRSAGLAARHGLDAREGEARLSRALVLAFAGRPEAGRREAVRAAGSLEGVAVGRALAQEAAILQVLGRHAEALEANRRALAVLRRHGVDDLVDMVLTNRGIAHAYRGELGAARADFEEAGRRYADADQLMAAAEAVHNLGWVAALGGDVPTALRRYDEADEAFRRLGLQRARGLLDRCEALLAVGLAGDARAVAATAVARIAGEPRSAVRAEALLAVARAALAAGDLAEATGTAARAERLFTDQGRRPWAAVAAFVALRAEVADGHTVAPRRAAALAAELEAAGWGAAALDARLLAAEAALATGDGAGAATHLGAASAARRSPLAERRVRAWHAEALLRLQSGRRPAALRALRAGLDVLDANRAALGATELRAGVARSGSALARLGLELAVASGRPAGVLRWAERSRMVAAPPTPAPADPALEGALARLRAVTWELEEATFGADGRVPQLRRQQARLEAAVRAAVLRTAGDGRAVGRPRGLPELRDVLGARVLVELLVAGDAVHAVVVARRGATLRRLGRVDEVVPEVAHLRFALTRLASADGAADGDRAAAALRGAAGRVAALLLAPLDPLLGDAPLVVVPTGVVEGVPWAVLPPMRGRPVAVAPSAAAWLAATARRPARAGRPVALIAGPALRGATREVTGLATVHPDACVLRDGEATVVSARALLAGAPLAHVAAHGTFRGDNPRFSSLRLADGPLLVHDLEGLPDAPGTVVLSACHAAEATTTDGGEVHGLAGALLASGTGSVIASVAPVPDGPSVASMLQLHRALAAGRAPAEALGDTVGALDLDAPSGPAAALAGFVCYGGG